MDNLKLQSRF